MTTEQGFPHPNVMARHIDQLRVRATYLEGRMAEREARGEGRANGKAEHAALTWALPVLEAEHVAALRLARHILAMAGVPEGQRDAQIAAGHPR